MAAMRHAGDRNTVMHVLHTGRDAAGGLRRGHPAENHRSDLADADVTASRRGSALADFVSFDAYVAWLCIFWTGAYTELCMCA